MARNTGVYDRVTGTYQAAPGEYAYHATYPYLLGRVAAEGLTKNSVSGTASRAEFEQPDAVYFSNANGYHGEYGVVLLRFAWPADWQVHLAMPDAPLVEGRVEAVAPDELEVATRYGWLDLRQALFAGVAPYNLDEQAEGVRFPEAFLESEAPRTQEQSFLDDWLVGRMERGSQELLGAAAVRFGLSRGALPVSAEAEVALASLMVRTQAVLQQAGVESIRLYRGLEDVGEVQPGVWQEGSLSSWTANPEAARAHAQGPHGRVISTLVGRERIVGFFGTGMGSTANQEYVLRGGDLEVEVEDLVWPAEL